MKTALTSIAVVTLSLAPVAVQAASFSVAPSARGWVSESGVLNGSAPDNNYIAGNIFADAEGASEFRNFFQFSLPNFTGVVTSARLRLEAGLMRQQPQLDYRLTSLGDIPDAAGDFQSLGTGRVFGRRSFNTEDNRTMVSIRLNAAGVAAMTSGTNFLVSGRVTNIAFGPDKPILTVFGATRLSPATLEFETAVAAVPEPASWAMLITGFGLAGSALRRRRAAIA